MKFDSVDAVEQEMFQRWQWKSVQFKVDQLVARGLGINPFGCANALVERAFDLPRPSEIGWLKAARMAMQLSGNELALRLGVSRQAYSKLERSELAGDIKLKTLRRLAEVMGCEVVYVIRPKHGTYAEVIWRQMKTQAIVDLTNAKDQSVEVLERRLTWKLSMLPEDAKARRSLLWTERYREQLPGRLNWYQNNLVKSNT